MSYASTAEDWGLGLGTRDADAGVGETSQQVQRELQSVQEHVRGSISLGWQYSIIDDIRSLADEFSEPGWDGYDALPIGPQGVESAEHFASLLPDNLAPPELTPENDGNFSFDWQSPNGVTLSVSVHPDKLIYAGLIGPEKIHGDVPFVREIPDNVEKILTNYFSRVG